MKASFLTQTEIKIIKMCLNDDDRVSQFYNTSIFHANNLPDIIQRLRKKISTHFKITHEEAKEYLYTERREITRSDGRKKPIGIYRIKNTVKNDFRKLIGDVKGI